MAHGTLIKANHLPRTRSGTISVTIFGKGRNSTGSKALQRTARDDRCVVWGDGPYERPDDEEQSATCQRRLATEDVCQSYTARLDDS
jgi:hypothetical protein